MRSPGFVWKKDFNIGNELIDEDHKKLYTVLRHLLENEDPSKEISENLIFMVRETIKFLLHYTESHFAAEEAYMEELKYPGLAMHKKLHANFKDIILPQLIADVENSKYGRDEVVTFISQVTGWFSGHIYTEDRAIVGRAISRYNNISIYDGREFLDREFKRFVRSFFFLEAKTINLYYDGEELKETFAHEFEFTDEQGVSYVAIVVIERSMLHHIIKGLVGSDKIRIDKASINAYYALMSSVGRSVFCMQYPDRDFLFKGVSVFAINEYDDRFRNQNPRYSILWSTEKGRIGLILE